MNLLNHGKTDKLAYIEILSYTAFLTLIFFAYNSATYWPLIFPYLIIASLFIIFFPNLLFYIFIASFFFQKAIITKGLTAIFATDIFFILITMGYMIYYFQSKDKYKSIKDSRAISIIMLLFFLISLISLLINMPKYQTTTIIISLWYMSKFIQLLICFFIFSDNNLNIDFHRIIKIVFAFALIQLPIVLFQYSGYSGFDLQFTRGMVTGTLTYHHGMLGTFMMIPMALSLGAMWESKETLNKVKYLALSFSFLLVVILSSARSAVLGLGIASVVYALSKFKFNLKYFLSLFGGTVAASLIILLSPLKDLLILTFSNSFNPVFSLDFATVYRFFIWKATVMNFISTDILQKLFGTGIGTFNTINFPFVIESGNKWAAGAHNQFLHILSEAGLVGLVLFLLLFYNILKVLYRYSEENSYAKAYYFLTIAMLASSLTQETFWFQKAFGSIWLFYTLILTLILKYCSESTSVRINNIKGINND